MGRMASLPPIRRRQGETESRSAWQGLQHWT
jgi:hypothetical protein